MPYAPQGGYPQQYGQGSAVPQGQVYHVYGIPIRDEGTAKLTRKVMNISLGMVAFSMVTWIVSIVAMTQDTDNDEDDDTSSRTFSVSVVAALCIPLCGYFGAKNRNPNLLNAFWVCNLLCVIDFVITLIVVITLLQEGELNDVGTSLWTTFIVFGIGAAILQCAGVIYGKKLASEEYWNVVTPANIPVAAPVASTVPQYAQPVHPSQQPAGYPVGYPGAQGQYPPGGSAPQMSGQPYGYSNSSLGQPHQSTQYHYV
eukprot:gb/GECG01015223.1/.p1 GENE.gb/GECG01015223.1/~~gb/GECG01015223.1/.p1  ORF type:complete len:256 (+),score=23.30 gb/GECG01015223.1/:1-768(+)